MMQQQVRDSREEYLQVCMSKGRHKQFRKSAVEPRMAAKRFFYDQYDQKQRPANCLYKLGMSNKMLRLQSFSLARTAPVSPQQNRMESCLKLVIIISCLADPQASH